MPTDIVSTLQSTKKRQSLSVLLNNSKSIWEGRKNQHKPKTLKTTVYKAIYHTLQIILTYTYMVALVSKGTLRREEFYEVHIINIFYRWGNWGIASFNNSLKVKN